ncbi:MAG: hypothetical protein ABSH09_29750 [Bryobacteraceae bacterium]
MKSRLRIRAALNEEKPRSLNLAESMRRHIDPLGGVDLTIPARQRVRRPLGFAK